MILTFSFFVFACGQTHTVNISFESNGGSSYEPISVNSGEMSYNPPIPAKAEFVFENWYTDAALTTLYTYSILESSTDLTLYAKYLSDSQTEYVIVTFATIGGSYIPNQVILAGTVPTQPEAPVKTGAEFSYWTIDTVAGYATYDFTLPLSSHTTLYAEYTTSDEYSEKN